ncbi:hypothetical protein B0I37DRAFT_10739 [Chaetomium sp. MPI-CAGE-AT-0009]|nr:hypothetical protein B0I37DRAFT_10739 [Chaetomium sp. MPI-CAGE-AT-0009]
MLDARAHLVLLRLAPQRESRLAARLERTVHPGYGTLRMGKGFTILHLGQVRVKGLKGTSPPFPFPTSLVCTPNFFPPVCGSRGGALRLFHLFVLYHQSLLHQANQTKLPDPSHLPPVLPIMTAVTFPRRWPSCETSPASLHLAFAFSLTRPLSGYFARRGWLTYSRLVVCQNYPSQPTNRVNEWSSRARNSGAACQQSSTRHAGDRGQETGSAAGVTCVCVCVGMCVGAFLGCELLPSG